MTSVEITREEATVGIRALGFIGPHDLTLTELKTLAALIGKLEKVSAEVSVGPEGEEEIRKIYTRGQLDGYGERDILEEKRESGWGRISQRWIDEDRIEFTYWLLARFPHCKNCNKTVPSLYTAESGEKCCSKCFRADGIEVSR